MFENLHVWQRQRQAFVSSAAGPRHTVKLPLALWHTEVSPVLPVFLVSSSVPQHRPGRCLHHCQASGLSKQRPQPTEHSRNLSSKKEPAMSFYTPNSPIQSKRTFWAPGNTSGTGCYSLLLSNGSGVAAPTAHAQSSTRLDARKAQQIFMKRRD